MIRQHVRAVLLAGVIVATAAVSAGANDCCQPAPCAPQTRTVCVKEWVPEKYETTRTVYVKEQRQECYTAYRCETVQEERTRTCTVNHYVSEMKEVCRKVPVRIPCCEERTVMKPCYHYVNENKVVRKCVDKGHYECKEVPCGPSFLDRLRECFHRKDCCDEHCEPCAVRTKTVKVWVPCPVWEERTVTCMKRVCEKIPVKCQVTVCKTQIKTETYTCLVQKKVPYEATRTVVHCVPHEQKVTCTRMVCRTVQKQVPVETCCATSCCKPRWFHLSGGLGFRHHGCCD